MGDGISNLLCPLVFEIKSTLEVNKKKILTSENIAVLKAMLCANREADPEKIKIAAYYSVMRPTLMAPKGKPYSSWAGLISPAFSSISPSLAAMRPRAPVQALVLSAARAFGPASVTNLIRRA